MSWWTVAEREDKTSSVVLKLVFAQLVDVCTEVTWSQLTVGTLINSPHPSFPGGVEQRKRIRPLVGPARVLAELFVVFEFMDLGTFSMVCIKNIEYILPYLLTYLLTHYMEHSPY